MSTIQIGVDLAKTVFEVALSEAPGVVTTRRRLSRAAFPRFLAAQAPAEVLLEACGSAHHWGREAQRLGHRVTLLHPADVARYRDGNKTDRADAKALLEAARNQALTPVPVKSVEQQAVVALHRIRQGYLRTRTARTCPATAQRSAGSPSATQEPLPRRGAARHPRRAVGVGR